MIDPKQPDYDDTPAAATRPRFGYLPADPGAAPLVSIVTPSFNTTDVLIETAESVRRQSLVHWEWLIVDDASTDPTALAVLQRVAALDPRIRVLRHETNLGPGAARNTGYRAARAEYVFQLDDDDLIEPTALEILHWFLETNPQFALANGWSVAFGAQRYLWSTGFDRGNDLLIDNVASGRALVRKSAWRAAGGFDEAIRSGMEDWDFWLRLAAAGLWGATLPEYIDWYRRRPNHEDRWRDWDRGARQQQFLERLRATYPKLYSRGVPPIKPRPPEPGEPIRDVLLGANRLRKTGPRLLLIAPWLTLGGADKFNLDLVRQLIARGWEVSIATTLDGEHAWLHAFARCTPDIFRMHSFARPADQPAFLRYLIESRDIDVVLLSNSELGYLLLPYLRTHCPRPAYVDYCHSQTPEWKFGGFPRYSVDGQAFLDRTCVASQHLQRWMAAHGADPGKIEVVYINVDADEWRPDADVRARVRAELRLAADEALILFAGRLHADKQPLVLARVVRALAGRGLHFRTLVAGDGPERDALEAFIGPNGLTDRLVLLGAQTPARVRDLLRAADLFFLPSALEGIALTIYEAMACGVPVVGADVGGQRELLTPDCGVLLPRGPTDDEVARYADAIETLLRDPQRRALLGRNGRRRILEGFTLDAMGSRMDALLRGLSAAPRTAAPVSRELGRVLGELAVEHLRMSRALDKYWVMLNGSPEDAHGRALLELRKERDQLWSEAQKLGQAWNIHTDHIRALEKANAELQAALDRSNPYRWLRRRTGQTLRWLGLRR